MTVFDSMDSIINKFNEGIDEMTKQEFTRYRFINELTGEVLYLMNIDVEVDHASRIDKKKNDLAYKKNIEYCNIICEAI